MANWFFYGTLCHPPHLATLLGHPVAISPARLTDHAVERAAAQHFPILISAPGQTAQGMLARDLTAADEDRLDFYEGGLGYGVAVVTVESEGGTVEARVWQPTPGFWDTDGPWSLSDWVRDWYPTADATMADLLALKGTRPAAELLSRYPLMMVRGASRVRAADSPAIPPRHAASASDVQVADYRQPYAHFFAVEEYDLSFRRFDGRMSPVINRATFVTGDAVTVLPYDPVRDRVLLVEQFRAGPFARGDHQPWQIEAIAGRIDPGESPEQAARREAVEEAGLTLGALLPVSQYYPSPGAVTEYLYSYVALTDLPDGSAGTFGLDEEAEDIRGHLLDFPQMMELVANGGIGNAPLILTALWLERERPRLQAEAKPGAVPPDLH